MDGKKFDSGKRQWSLLPFPVLEDVVAVLEHGAEKYGADNWKRLEDAKERYFNAAMRHLISWKDGEIFDKESGLSHTAHLACNALFLCWFDKNEFVSTRTNIT